jgi:hypothetical protein
MQRDDHREGAVALGFGEISFDGFGAPRRNRLAAQARELLLQFADAVAGALEADQLVRAGDLRPHEPEQNRHRADRRHRKASLASIADKFVRGSGWCGATD